MSGQVRGQADLGMVEAFNQIKEEILEFEEDEDLNKKIWDFQDYIESTYVGSEEQLPRFPLENLSKYEEILKDKNCHLDNNVAESFNRQFSEALPKNPTVWGIIQQFSKEEAFSRSKFLKSISGDPISQDNEKRRQKREKQCEALYKILKNLEEKKIKMEVAIVKLMKYKDNIL